MIINMTWNAGDIVNYTNKLEKHYEGQREKQEEKMIFSIPDACGIRHNVEAGSKELAINKYCKQFTNELGELIKHNLLTNIHLVKKL